MLRTTHELREKGWRGGGEGRRGRGLFLSVYKTLHLNNLTMRQSWWSPSPPSSPSSPSLPPRHLGSQLAELERAIEKMMEADFVKFAMEDIQQRQQYAQEMATAHSTPERTDSEVHVAILDIVYVCCCPIL